MTATRLNHASPWVIDTRPLGRRPGTLREMRIRLTAEDRVGFEVIAVPAGSELALELRLESVVEGVLVSGTVSAVAGGQCCRCLIDLEQPVTAGLQELYAYPGSTTAATTDDDEIPRLQDDLIDLEPLVRDEIVLALPLAPLCGPDCAGLCPDCGERLGELEPGHHHETMDPRWAALADRRPTADAGDTNTEEK